MSLSTFVYIMLLIDLFLYSSTLQNQLYDKPDSLTLIKRGVMKDHTKVNRETIKKTEEETKINQLNKNMKDEKEKKFADFKLKKFEKVESKIKNMKAMSQKEV